MSAVQNYLEKQNKIMAAMTDPIRLVAKIIPLLEQRHFTAKRLESGVINDADTKKHFEDMLDYINTEISKILGL